MQELLSLRLHPVDVGAIALAVLFVISSVWMTVRPGGLIGQKLTKRKIKRQQLQSVARPHWTPDAASEDKVAMPAETPSGPASLSPLEQLSMIIKHASIAIEQSRQAISLTGLAVMKLDAVEQDLMDLFGEVAAVSGYAQRRAAERSFGIGARGTAAKPAGKPIAKDEPRSIAA